MFVLVSPFIEYLILNASDRVTCQIWNSWYKQGALFHSVPEHCVSGCSIRVVGSV